MISLDVNTKVQFISLLHNDEIVHSTRKNVAFSVFLLKFKVRSSIKMGSFINFRFALFAFMVSTALPPSTPLMRKQPSFQTVTFDPSLFEEQFLNNTSSETEIRSNRDFILRKNDFRAKAYAKAVAALAKDSRQTTKDSIKLTDEINSVNVGDANGNGSSIFACYYSIPTMNDRPWPVFPESIDPFLCTHILVAFARVVNGTIAPNDIRDLEFYNRTVKLKEKNANLKVMLSIGSTNDNSVAGKEFVAMMSSNVTRQRFVLESLKFIKSYGFDGLDIDWEFPCWYGPMEQKQQLSSLFQEYRESMKQQGIVALLSAAVPAPKYLVDLGYDVPNLAKNLDFVNVMTYDFHMYSWYSPLTGQNAPLYTSSTELAYLKTMNTAWAAKYWYQNGMPAEKVVVGIPTYGRTYKLVESQSHDLYSLAMGFGNVGENGYAAYPELCQFLEKNNNTTVVFQNETRAPYAYAEREWISFDNEQSATEKAKFAKTFGFGGVMFWCINHDDAYKLCKTTSVAFPIITSAKNAIV